MGQEEGIRSWLSGDGCSWEGGLEGRGGGGEKEREGPPMSEVR